MLEIDDDVDEGVGLQVLGYRLQLVADSWLGTTFLEKKTCLCDL